MPGWTHASTMPEPARERAERSVPRELLAFAGRTPLSAAGAIVGLLVVAMALGAPWIAPHDPLKTNFRRMNHAPDAQSLFGTDQVGRDTLSRVIRSVAITVREMAYVEAGRASGASAFRIMRLHVLPQCVAPYLVLATTHLGVAIVIEAALGFLGVGVPPPTPTWGNMLADSITGLVPRWWLVLFPGLAITITVLAFNLLGDGIRDTLDPRLSPGFLRLVTGSGRGTAAVTPTRPASLQENRTG